MTATDRLRHDGTVTIWQWQRKIGDKWSPILLPCTGDGYKKPLHDKRWAKFYDTWQKHGVHGFESEADALACLEMVVAYVRRDDGTRPEYNQPKGRGKERAWPEWRLAKITMSLATATVMTGNASVEGAAP